MTRRATGHFDPALRGVRDEQIAAPYPKPRIYGVDVPGGVLQALRAAGYSVQQGTFGSAREMKRTRQRIAVRRGDSLPDYPEQEVVLANTAPVAGPVPDAQPPEDYVPTLTLNLLQGTVDARPVAMHVARGDSDRILAHGGVFIVTACPRYTLVYEHGTETHRGFELGKRYELDNWGFLSILAGLTVEEDSGREMQFASTELGRLLA